VLSNVHNFNPDAKIIVCIDGLEDEENIKTEKILKKKQKSEGKPDVILVNSINQGRTRTLKNIIGYIIEDFRPSVLKNTLFSYVDSDYQQRWDEMYNSLLIKFENPHNRQYLIGHFERVGSIKMAEERVEHEKIVNLAFYFLLTAYYIKNDDVARLKFVDATILRASEGKLNVSSLVPTKKAFVRDLQNHLCMRGEILKDCYKYVLGRKHTFELEILLYAIENKIPLLWGKRKDYGLPKKDYKKELMKEQVAEFLYVMGKHLDLSRREIVKYSHLYE